jgi:hypothetical protein
MVVSPVYPEPIFDEDPDEDPDAMSGDNDE